MWSINGAYQPKLDEWNKIINSSLVRFYESIENMAYLHILGPHED